MSQDKYSYSSQPHAAPMKRKSKYRDDSDSRTDENSRNLMNDPRVIRGSTYSAKASTISSKPTDSIQKGSFRSDRSRNRQPGRRVSTPPPVDGRNHMEMQTEDFLEELTDRAIEIDAETQTQPFMDRPPSPLFVRAVTGKDVDTQILPGDLFDFDLEVEPILEVLVGKTIHVSMLELMQEEELEAIRLQQEEFEAIRNVELAEVQRLEADARRRNQEKERRLAQEKERVEAKRVLEEKIAARAFSRQYLSSLHSTVFDTLESEGVFFDPVRKEVQEIFLVDVMKGLNARTMSFDVSVSVMDGLLEDVRGRAKAFEVEAMRLRKEMEERMKAEKLAQIAEMKRRQAEEEAARKATEALEEES